MAAKRRWTSQDDPRLHTASWLDIRETWRMRLAAAIKEGGGIYCEAPICKARGVPIQQGGVRGPWHLDVGHIIPREHDTRLTWTIEDTRPEHARCNRSAGVEVGRRKAMARRAAMRQAQGTQSMTINNDDW